MSSSTGISTTIISRIAAEIKDVIELGVEIAIVLGGGNIFRGIAGTAQGMDRAASDYMGMLATVINSLALQRSSGANRGLHSGDVGH